MKAPAFAALLCALHVCALLAGPARADGPIVDPYGQAAAVTWPGKIVSDDDLVQNARVEADVLAPYIRPPTRDVYGGWSGSPLEGRLLTTRFFHTTEIEDTWWLVTPDGNPFLALGCTGVRAGDATKVVGRADLFSWLPDPLDPRFAPALAGSGGKVFSFYRANLIRKYGPLAANRSSLDIAIKRMRAWGLNTAGAASDQGLLVPGKVPYVVELSLDPTADPAVPRAPETDIPDVYNPEWASQWQGRALACRRYADDPWCLGYVVREEGVRWDLLHSPLQLPVTFAARTVFQGAVKQEYGSDLAKFNRAWGQSVKSWDEVASLPQSAVKTAAARADAAAFLQPFAAAYFRAIRRAIAASDPHHLFLGTRLSLSADLPAPTLQGAAQFCDLLTVDAAGTQAPPIARLRRLYEITQKPLWLEGLGVGASGAEGHGLDPGPVTAPTQAARAALLGDYLSTSYALPFVVGACWSQWVDQPLTGRVRDGAHANTGLVDITDTPYAPLAAALGRANAAMYTTHDDPPPAPPKPKR